MEDTKSLLVMVLQKVFHGRPKVIDDTYQLIYNYNNGNKEKNEYEKTLKSICDLMNDELPSEILVYLLTLVDMPIVQDGYCQLPIVEKMQKTHNCLPERVRPHLLEYLRNCSKKNPLKNTAPPEQKPRKKEQFESGKQEVTTVSEMTSKAVPTQDNFAKPAAAKKTKIRRRTNKKNQLLPSDNSRQFNRHFHRIPFHSNFHVSEDAASDEVKSLMDHTANYVIKNEKFLKQMYKSKLEQAWKLIYSNAYKGDDLLQCYETVKDLNKKTKLLRMIENDNITDDFLFEEYKDSEVFLRERHMLHAINYDPFDHGPELVKKYLNNQ